jgi:hypothetical protein
VHRTIRTVRVEPNRGINKLDESPPIVMKTAVRGSLRLVSIQPPRRASGLNRDRTSDNMVDESTHELSLLVASLFVASLLSSRYMRDPLVSRAASCPSLPLLIELGGSQLAVIPTVGFSDSILSYFSVFVLSSMA